jgi:hypothetical protein
VPQHELTQVLFLQFKPSFAQSPGTVQSGVGALQTPVVWLQDSCVQGLPSPGHQSASEPVRQSATQPSTESQREQGGQLCGVCSQQPEAPHTSSVQAFPSSQEAPSAQQTTPAGQRSLVPQQEFTHVDTVQFNPSGLQSPATVQSGVNVQPTVGASQNSCVQVLPSSWHTTEV